MWKAQYCEQLPETVPGVVKSVFFRSSIVTNVKDNGCVHICHGSVSLSDVTGLGLIKKHCSINLNMPVFIM